MKGACVWCSALVTIQGELTVKQEVVCSQACAFHERSFRAQFSDEVIGARNLLDFGVNPNSRGKHAKKTP